MAIAKNLTVVKEFDGTDHWPAGSSVSVDLTCLQGGVEKAARLSVVLVNLVGGSVQEVSSYSAGTQALTKITSACTGLSAYVKENFYDVYAAQNPCCAGSNGGGGGQVNTTPAPPTVTGDDVADTLIASHALGASEIVFSTNGGAFGPYAGTINVGDVSRAQGYWQFKIKAATGRNESAVALSPAFTVAVVQAQKLAQPVLTFDNDQPDGTGFQVHWTKDPHSDQINLVVATDAAFTNIVSNLTGLVNAGNINVGSLTPQTLFYVKVVQVDSSHAYANSDPGTGSHTTLDAYDTILTFVASTSGAAENAKFGVGGTVAATGNVQKFEFNKIAGTLTGTPDSMNVNVGGNLEIVIDFQSDYVGHAFRYTDLSGNYRRGTFVNGDLNF